MQMKLQLNYTLLTFIPINKKNISFRLINFAICIHTMWYSQTVTFFIQKFQSSKLLLIFLVFLGKRGL